MTNDEIIFKTALQFQEELKGWDLAKDVSEEWEMRLYNLFNLWLIEASVYYAIGVSWTSMFSAWEWWKMDREISQEDWHYLCIAWWISIELYNDLKTVMKILDDITDILFKYENNND